MMRKRTAPGISKSSYNYVAAPLFLLALALPALAGQEYFLGPQESAIEEHLIVRLTHGAAASDVLATIAPGATAEPIGGESDIYLVRLRGSASSTDRVTSSTQLYSTRRASALLAAHPNVLYVQPDKVLTTQALSPNDPQFAAQWGFQNIQAVSGWGMAPGAFLTNATANSGRIKIAVLDTGADCTHPDFMNAGGSSTDSASGGQFSFALSNAYEPTSLPSPACPWQDDVGHGTHVAGIIAASANNAVGVAGLGYQLQLMVYKVMLLDSAGQAVSDTAVVFQAIKDAANNGAAVISMSLGEAGYDPTLQLAINYAWKKNTLVVAAAGNSGTNALNFPGGANYAIGVGATDSNDAWAGFSSYGAQVAVGAPGVNILSTLPGASYGYLSGTSMATPWVSALGGLLSSASPGASAAALKMRIEQSADNSNPGGAAGQYLGFGRINVASALSGTLRPATQGGVTGQVVDPINQFALANVTITVGGQTYTTDSSGLYRFYGLNAGEYTISASSAQYPVLSQQVFVAPGADTQFLVVMGGSPAQFTGTVSNSGVPVAGAIVQAIDGSGLIQSTAVTGANGQYFLYVQAGAYSVRASAVYYLATTFSPQTVAIGASATVNVNLPSMGRITGSIKLVNGSPATDATMSVSSGAATTTAILDSAGNFSTIGLAAADYTLLGSLPGLASVTASTVLTNDALPVMNLQFPDNGSNTVRAGISAKSGPASARQWSLSFTNQGTQQFSAVTVTGFGLVQQGGPTCTPRLLTPLPAVVGNVSASGVLAGSLTFDFSSCAATARFTATMPFTANSQATSGIMTLNNQFQ
jgi:thermitase